jgi:hypothetical protein
MRERLVVYGSFFSMTQPIIVNIVQKLNTFHWSGWIHSAGHVSTVNIRGQLDGYSFYLLS